LRRQCLGHGAQAPLILLGAIVAISRVFSAFLVNDAICLVLAPLVLELTLALGRWPWQWRQMSDRP
jgi:Na+/H+ antiporter NhaD/arsenite permease-like protein